MSIVSDEYARKLLGLQEAVALFLLTEEENGFAGSEQWCEALELMNHAFEECVLVAPSKTPDEHLGHAPYLQGLRDNIHGILEARANGTL